MRRLKIYIDTNFLEENPRVKRPGQFFNENAEKVAAVLGRVKSSETSLNVPEVVLDELTDHYHKEVKKVWEFMKGSSGVFSRLRLIKEIEFIDEPNEHFIEKIKSEISNTLSLLGYQIVSTPIGYPLPFLLKRLFKRKPPFSKTGE